MTTEAENKPAIGRVLQDSSLYLLGNVVGRLVGFFAIPFYTSYLSPAEYGLIELVELSTQTIAIALGLQAAGTALGRLFHDQAEADGTEGEAAKGAVSTAMIATALFSGAVTLLAVAAAPALSQLVFRTPEWAGLLRGAFLAMFLSEMVELSMVYERIRNRALFFLGYSLVTLAAMLSLNILFIAGLGWGVWGFIGSKLIVTGVGSAFLLFRVQRAVGWRWRGSLLPAFVRFGAPLVVSGLAFFAIHFSDHFFLSGTVGLAELGRYALAYRFAFLVSALVGDSFSKSWYPTLYRYARQPGWQAQFARVAMFHTAAVCFTGMGVALFSPEVLRIMVPPDFLPPPLLLPLLVGAYVVRDVGDFFASLLLLNRRTGVTGQVAAAMAGLNLGANFLLIPRFGVFGAAWATVLTWAVYAFVTWRIAGREHALPVPLGAYGRLVAVVGGVYALAAATRGGPLTVQIPLDGAWFLLFCGAGFLLFFGPAERDGVMGFLRSSVRQLRQRLGAS